MTTKFLKSTTAFQRRTRILVLVTFLLFALLTFNRFWFSLDASPDSAPIENQETHDESTTSSSKSSASSSTSIITIVTGTHFSAVALSIDERKQDPHCEQLANAIHAMWSAWEVNPYGNYKEEVRRLLKSLANRRISCTLSGSRKHSLLWTFPMSWRPDAECDVKTKQILETKSYLREKTKVYVNWFLIRPDLVTLGNMVSVLDGVEIRFAVSVGTQVSSAAFAQEMLCPRISTILTDKEVYKQRLLLVMASDVEHQVGRMPQNQVLLVSHNQCGEDSVEYLQWLNAKNSQEDDLEACVVHIPTKHTHEHSLMGMHLFSGGANHAVLAKTVFTGPRLIFVAGLEGVGHHVFSLLGKKHTTTLLYDALTDHLCDSAWDEDSLSKYAGARERLVQAMASQTPLASDGVMFLNTVYSDHSVNMYSYPWGGPRCFLKRYARILCNIDLIELVRMAEEARVDFRIVFLKRSVGAAVVSASLHRPFGTLVSETRMLAMSWALLKSGIDAVDRRFVLEMNYEDMINKPEESSQALGEFVGANPELRNHFLTVLQESNRDHPVGDGTTWKEEVDLAQFQFMSDLLGL